MEPRAEDDRPVTRSWPPRMRAVAAIGWSSFLAACLGTMLTFAALDPQLIIDGVHGPEGGEHGAAPWWLTRTGIYSIGFFLFWAVAAVAGLLTDYLHDSPSRKGGGS